MNEFKKEYEKIEIPPELEFVVLKTIKEQERKMKKNDTRKNKAWVAAAAAAVIFVGGINVSSNVSYALSELPVIGPVVKVLTFRNFKVEENNFEANLETPAIEGLDSNLEEILNKQYLEENQKLYDEFVKDMDKLKSEGHGDAHMGLDSGYDIKTDDDQLLVIGRYVTNTVASSSTTIQYDNIDKQNKILITLPSLFKDKNYISVISSEIKDQMKEQMKDENVAYWLEDEFSADNFESIKENQSFYINADHQLVIAFDKYEVAPGSMGNPEFVIPTEIIQSFLVSDAYIK